MDINKLKEPILYGKIPLILPHSKEDHMFTGLKHQLELTDTLVDDILPQDNKLIKLKKVLNWESINEIYSQCFSSNRGRPTKKTDIALGLLILKHLYKKLDKVYHDKKLLEELEQEYNILLAITHKKRKESLNHYLLKRAGFVISAPLLR